MSLLASALTLRARVLKTLAALAPVAPALLRLTLGVVFIQSGWGKLTSLGDVTTYFESLHIPMPAVNAVVASSTEFFGGILLILGLGTRLVALPMAFTMVVAMLTEKRSEIDGVASLLALNEFAYFAMFVTLVLLGAGAWSLDALVARKLESATPLQS